MIRSDSAITARLGGAALAGVFRTLGAIRRGKPLHPKGVAFDAVLRRAGSARRWGASWLDEPGEDRCLVRFSRAVGLPSRVPDILGLGLTFTDAGGRHDLLLATTGLSRATRFLLVPRMDPWTSAYGSLFPYHSPQGLVALCAVPAPQSVGRAEHSAFRLGAAGPGERWWPFGTLKVMESPLPPDDQPVRFDPIQYPLPGLWWPRSLAALREPSYAAARRRPLR